MNPDLQKLHPYPFEKLRHLFAGITPASKPTVLLSIGEPKHEPADFIIAALQQDLRHNLAKYPLTKGEALLRQTIANWLTQRFSLPHVDAERQILPVAGTREALFAFAQAVVNRNDSPVVVMPNPFYQIYEGAALLAGAEPYMLPTTQESDYLPDLDAVPQQIWQRTQLFYLCSPGNPTGKVAPLAYMQRLIDLAERYDFIIAADECYTELYPDENNPPPGMLQAAALLGNHKYKRCIVFHSLSKRSNVPGLRSGFIAGDADIVNKFLLYRTYHGCALPLATQQASIAAWSDEEHVQQNRALYRQKFTEVCAILQPYIDVPQPDAGFYLWPNVAADDCQFAADLYQQQNVTVLPGQYLSRTSNGRNPGYGHIRMALVAPLTETVDAAHRIAQFIQQRT